MTASPADANNDPVAKFIALKADIDAALTALVAASAEHFDVDPDTLNWGDFGSAEEVLSHLRQAMRWAGVTKGEE